MTIWHIFKKDLRLLWPFVIAVATLWWIEDFILFRLGLFGENPVLANLSRALLPFTAVFGTMFLVVAITHLDSVPGVKQDWLVRPIPRGKLLLEKFLFALVLVVGPVLAANVFQGIANGFAIRAALGAAASGAVIFACLFVLPFFALGSVTENMTGAFIFGSVCAAIGTAILSSANDVNDFAHGTIITAAQSGISWIPVTLQLVLVAIGASLVLWLQYFHRRTMAGRLVIAGFGFVILAAQLLPWKPAFAIEKHFSAQPSAEAGVDLAFDADLGKFKSPSGVASSLKNFQPNRGDQPTDVFLPLRTTGIPDDSILLSDRVDLYVSSEGRQIYRGVGERVQIDPAGTNSPNKPAYQEVQLPTSFYASAKEKPVAVRAEYSLTIFRLASSYSLPALNGSERMPGLGWCQTQINEAETAVELHCMQLSRAPICAMLFLENTSTGAQNPPRSICSSDYGLSRPPLPDVIERYAAIIPFRDATGLAKYPVDGSQLAESKVVIRLYEPVDHFNRTVTIPEIRLRDWDAE